MVTPSVLDIVCLCAAWCGTCRDYEATFAELQTVWPQHRYRWIDIEDEADFIGEVDVETFPTLLVVRQGQVMFAGPVLPRLGDAQRLIEVLQQAGQGAVPGAVLQGLPVAQVEALAHLARAIHVNGA